MIKEGDIVKYMGKGEYYGRVFKVGEIYHYRLGWYNVELLHHGSAHNFQLKLHNLKKMEEYTIEYEEYWFDCNTSTLNTINIYAESKEKAIENAKEELEKLDIKDNSSGGKYWNHENNPMVSRSIKFVTLYDNYKFEHSLKEPRI